MVVVWWCSVGVGGVVLVLVVDWCGDGGVMVLVLVLVMVVLC